jgi:hypothetical protein
MTDFGPTGDKAVAEYRKKHPKERESPKHNCMNSISGLRFKIMADMMEKKVKTLRLSSKEHSEWEADIAAVQKVCPNRRDDDANGR